MNVTANLDLKIEILQSIQREVWRYPDFNCEYKCNLKKHVMSKSISLQQHNNVGVKMDLRWHGMISDEKYDYCLEQWAAETSGYLQLMNIIYIVIVHHRSDFYENRIKQNICINKISFLKNKK